MSVVTDPKTQPPSEDKPYWPVMGADGKERWVLLARDADDVEDADFEFHDDND
jgi:hypothetical protein